MQIIREPMPAVREGLFNKPSLPTVHVGYESIRNTFHIDYSSPIRRPCGDDRRWCSGIEECVMVSQHRIMRSPAMYQSRFNSRKTMQHVIPIIVQPTMYLSCLKGKFLELTEQGIQILSFTFSVKEESAFRSHLSNFISYFYSGSLLSSFNINQSNTVLCKMYVAVAILRSKSANFRWVQHNIRSQPHY